MEAKIFPGIHEKYAAPNAKKLEQSELNAISWKKRRQRAQS